MRFHTSNTVNRVNCRFWQISSAADGGACLRFGDPPGPASPIVTSLTAHWYESLAVMDILYTDGLRKCEAFSDRFLPDAARGVAKATPLGESRQH